ncbi:MAG: hypothetical protein IJE43_18970 [Alphaproteobacteria bacterium]|nr:hypothetical protein [Alphaproteobacteria bacterium]
MRKNKSVLAFVVFLIFLFLVIVIGAFVITFNKKDVIEEGVVQYMTGISSEEMSIVDSSNEVTVFEDTITGTESSIIGVTEEQAIVQSSEVDLDAVGYNVVLNSKSEIEDWLSLIGANTIDYETPYSLSGNIVIFESMIDGNPVQIQIITDGKVITNMSLLQEVNEHVSWLPVGDTDRSDDLIIVEVGQKKFDISYGEHAKLFEVIVNRFNLTDPLGASTYVEMVDCEKENTIEVLITNNQAVFYIQDVGEFYKVWQEDELSAVFLEKGYPYIETSPF